MSTEQERIREAIEMESASKEDVDYEGPTRKYENLNERVIKGTNPQNLIEKIIRLKINESNYYKEHCFGLNAETLVDKAIDLDAVGGTYGGNRKPTKFLCLAYKMLQIQPEKEIVIAYIENENHKYVRALGAFYLRLTGTPSEVYQYLEALYNDYRKIRKRLVTGKYVIIHMDEFIDELLTSQHACDVALPYLPKRFKLEEAGYLKPRKSLISESEITDSEEEQEEQKKDDFKLKYKRKTMQEIEEEMMKKEEEERKRLKELEFKKDEKQPPRSYSSYYRYGENPEFKKRGYYNLEEEYKLYKKEKEKQRESKSRGGEQSLSVEETNELRKKLGLKPLK